MSKSSLFEQMGKRLKNVKFILSIINRFFGESLQKLRFIFDRKTPKIGYLSPKLFSADLVPGTRDV